MHVHSLTYPAITANVQLDTMQFSTASLSFLALIAASVVSAEKQIQINYYSNSGCSDFLGQVDVTWATALWGGQNNCYNYQYGNSVNIVYCSKPGGCFCNFYYQSNCQGGATQQAQSSGNCIGGAQQLKSFACYYR